MCSPQQVVRLSGHKRDWSAGCFLPSWGLFLKIHEVFSYWMGQLISEINQFPLKEKEISLWTEHVEQRIPNLNRWQLSFTVCEQNSGSSQPLWRLLEWITSLAPLTPSHLAFYSSISHQKHSWNYSSWREYPFSLLNSNTFSFKSFASGISVANSVSVAKRHTKTMANGGKKELRLIDGPQLRSFWLSGGVKAHCSRNHTILWISSPGLFLGWRDTTW